MLADEVSSTPLIVIAAGCGLVTILAIWRVNETRGRDLAHE